MIYDFSDKYHIPTRDFGGERWTFDGLALVFDVDIVGARCHGQISHVGGTVGVVFPFQINLRRSFDVDIDVLWLYQQEAQERNNKKSANEEHLSEWKRKVWLVQSFFSDDGIKVLLTLRTILREWHNRRTTEYNFGRL